uniref:Tyrosine-protein kinase n=1 Tax=Caenorhabditis japonica TaxID=281687 RepID=A0A8R1E109_CAEJA
MPEAVPPIAVPSNPPPSRSTPDSSKPPVPPRRTRSTLEVGGHAPPIPAHSSLGNLRDSTSGVGKVQRKDHSHDGSVTCRHGDCDEKMLIAESRFIAQTQSEMSVEEGDVLYLIEQSSSQWWYVTNKSRQFKGHVPKSHVVFAELREPWFARNISSILAEQRVMQPNLPIGTFLIRENIKKGTFVLTVRSSNDDPPKAYTIHRQPGSTGFEMRDTNGRIIIRFGSLIQLVHHFSCEKVPGEVQICTKLTLPAPPLSLQPAEYVTMRKWQVDRKEVKRVRSIGKGQFGEVYLAKWMNVDVAVKMLKPNDMEQLANSQFLEEAKTLTRLSHQNVICLLAVCALDQPYLIITEYMKNGSLLTWLHATAKRLPPPLLMGDELARKNLMIGASISAQVASGMDYLSANHIVHRDLAARNVLVGEISSNGVPLVKVADFGLARKMDLNEMELIYMKKTDNPLPWKWMAPESFRMDVFNTKTDVWSFGVLLWEIGTFGEVPYRGLDYEGALEKLEAGYVLPRPGLVPEYVYEDAIRRCLYLNPQQRLTFDQLFKYFDDINSESLSVTKTRAN